MREIVVVQWCDGEHVELTRASHSHQLAIGNARAVQLDLCDDCDRVMVDLAELLANGRKDDAATPSRATTVRGTSRIRQDSPNAKSRPCPVCGKRSTTETGLRQHFGLHHSDDYNGQSLLQFEGARA